jgi:hypothetical protein
MNKNVIKAEKITNLRHRKEDMSVSKIRIDVTISVSADRNLMRYM